MPTASTAGYSAKAPRLTLSRVKVKGRRENNSFIALPHNIIEHENWANLSPRAVKLLIDLYGQYRGANNGDLCMVWSLMWKRGWTSRDQLSKARKELLDKGWIVLTRQGGKNRPSLYAVTFKPIDECKGKLDRPSSNTALRWWTLGYNPEQKNLLALNTGYIDPPHGLVRAVK